MSHRYGPLSHPAAQAGTVHDPMPAEASAPKGIVATFARAAGGAYQVVRDALAHQGVGLYRVLAGERYVGSQVSRPSAEDCARLERERDARPAPVEPRRFVYGYSHAPRPRRGRPRKVAA